MATLEQPLSALPSRDDGVRRRDFINIAAVSFAGVGAAAVVVPLVIQMNPSADVLALASTEVDISKIAPGQAIKTVWRKQPVFVRNLTPKEIAEANAVPLSRPARSADARRADQAGQGELADHAGRVHPSRLRPAGHRRRREPGRISAAISARATARHYDTAARIRKGPAPTNLLVPEYEFTSDTVVTIG